MVVNCTCSLYMKQLIRMLRLLHAVKHGTKSLIYNTQIIIREKLQPTRVKLKSSNGFQAAYSGSSAQHRS